MIGRPGGRPFRWALASHRWLPEALGRSEDVPRALESLGSLVAFGAPRCRLVRTHLADPEPYVRRAALEASVKLLMPPRAHEGMAEEEAVAAAAARQAAQESAEVQSMLDMMLKRLELDEDWGVKRLALAAIGEFCSPGREDVLEKVEVGSKIARRSWIFDDFR